MYGASVEQEVNWLGGELRWNLPSPGFCQVVKRLPHDWQDRVEEFPSKATSVQDVTTLPGIIFAPKVMPLFVTGGVGFDGSFKKKLAVSVVIDCSWSKLGGRGYDEVLCDLECPMNPEEKEIVEVKAGMSEEIERVKSASNTKETCSRQNEERGPLIGGVTFGSTSPDDRSNSRIAAMKLRIAGFKNEQATRVASFKSKMYTLWAT